MKSGSSDMRRAESCLPQPIRRSDSTTIVTMASDSGTTKTSSSVEVISVVASQRRPHSRSCSQRSAGQVATTTIVAQITAPRNGRRIHSEPRISTPIVSTLSVMRASSRRGSVMAFFTRGGRPAVEACRTRLALCANPAGAARPGQRGSVLSPIRYSSTARAH